MKISQEDRKAPSVLYREKNGLRFFACANCGWCVDFIEGETLPTYCGGCGLRSEYMSKAQWDERRQVCSDTKSNG